MRKAAAEPGHARYGYRLRVSSAARTALMTEWNRSRWVWNECVAKSKAVYAHNQAHPEAKQTCGPAQLDRMLTEARAVTPWLAKGSSVAQQQIIRDFGRSRAKALKDIDDRVPQGRRAGMPGYKKKHGTRPTLNYTRRGFRLKGGRLHLAGGIVLTVVWSRNLPAAPTSVRVYQDSVGHWYASFVVPARVEPLRETGLVLGVDWGVKEIATTTSDAHDLPHAEFGKQAQAKLYRYDRMTARRRPAKGQTRSKGYQEAQRWRARTYQKIARQRQDAARKWAKKVVRDHDAIAAEDFRPKFLAKTTMARKAADAAIGAAKKALVEMGHKHARDVRLFRAGLAPSGAEGARPPGAPLQRLPEPGIPSLPGRGAVNCRDRTPPVNSRTPVRRPH
ncbi:RNA-guided endonuclease InsQ/TnpB family protein [Streptomyces chartreusis]|uniref:RNA-guided endonuclease InsQ/TnpB family protein n=1 Tax=Streptomyces chartreusis TaxID=1969 RepID=UPI003F4D7541